MGGRPGPRGHRHAGARVGVVGGTRAARASSIPSPPRGPISASSAKTKSTGSEGRSRKTRDERAEEAVKVLLTRVRLHLSRRKGDTSRGGSVYGAITPRAVEEADPTTTSVARASAVSR